MEEISQKEEGPIPNRRWSKSKFKKFLSKLLERGNVKQKHIDLFLTKENLKKFKVAFTHPSMHEGDDYNIYEFLGDPIINGYVAYYIRERFPKIVHVKWYNRLKHYLISDRVFARIAMNEGLENFVRYGEDIEYLRLNPEQDEKEEYLKMMEDVLEAFFGCLSSIIVSSGKPRGVAIAVCDSILKSYLDGIQIPLTFEELFDPVTILKELYEDKQVGLLWPNDQAYLFEKHEGAAPLYTAIVYGWPLGDRKASFKNRHIAMSQMHIRGEYTEIKKEIMSKYAYLDPNKTILAVATAKNKKDAKMKAAKEALKVLREKYNIVSPDQDPYSKKKYDSSKSALAKSRIMLE